MPMPIWRESVTKRAGSLRDPSLLLLGLRAHDRDFRQPHGLDAVVLDLDRVVFLAVLDLRGGGELALALPVLAQPDLHEDELVVGRAGLVRGLAEAHGPVGGDDDATPAVG